MVKAKYSYYCVRDKQEPMEVTVYWFKLNVDMEL